MFYYRYVFCWACAPWPSDSPRFNPMSYHDGSIWPHDNALIALGLARYGMKRAAAAPSPGLFHAASHMELMRFPELFGGFRRRGTAPTLYPVACAPQAWASAAPFALLEASLGIVLGPPAARIAFPQSGSAAIPGRNPHPNLSLDGASADLRLRRNGAGTEVAILAQHGDISVA